MFYYDFDSFLIVPDPELPVFMFSSVWEKKNIEKNYVVIYAFFTEILKYISDFFFISSEDFLFLKIFPGKGKTFFFRKGKKD